MKTGKGDHYYYLRLYNIHRDVCVFMWIHVDLYRFIWIYDYLLFNYVDLYGMIMMEISDISIVPGSTLVLFTVFYERHDPFGSMIYLSNMVIFHSHVTSPGGIYH